MARTGFATRGRLPVLAAVACALIAICCRGRSPRDEVAAVIDDMAERVERKDAAGLVSHLAADYRDFEGRDRARTQTMAEEYFGRYRGIKVKVLASRISLSGEGRAASETDVSLYSGVASALRKAVGFHGENYRVSCVLRREASWRISEARWEYVPVQGLFPESLEILRKIFPDL